VSTAQQPPGAADRRRLYASAALASRAVFALLTGAIMLPA
jgi:hypothetical protein